jgi:hypothetical protein
MNRFEKIAKQVTGYSVYQGIIHPILQKLGRVDIDPRHVEAYCRLDSPTGTLDSWSHSKFVQVMPEIIEAIDQDPRQAEKLADSYGL